MPRAHVGHAVTRDKTDTAARDPPRPRLGARKPSGGNAEPRVRGHGVSLAAPTSDPTRRALRVGTIRRGRRVDGAVRPRDPVEQRFSFQPWAARLDASTPSPTQQSQPEVEALATAAVTWTAPPSGAAAPDAPLRFIALGGGYTPESNEVSLEQDIELLQRTLPGPGRVLFAGGGASPTVRELDPAPRGDPVELALGELILPLGGRNSHYRAARFEAQPATEPNVRATLTAAFDAGGPPLLLYIAAHGSGGSEPKDNTVALWGEGELSVAQLDELHRDRPRPLRLVVTSCYSGGFADLAFWHADAGLGHRSEAPRCGVFAGTSDRPTSGCDPDPDRRAQESYSLHMAHGLSGMRRDGTPLPLELADFDHDGTIGLLDAHTWARLEASSIDVPTTTSERWLERHAPPSGAAIDPQLSPEDIAVVERLGAALGVTDEDAARARWSTVGEELDALSDQVAEADAKRDADTAAERAALLARWPVLADPLHPDFDVTLRDNREAVEQLLTSSPEAQARRVSQQRVRALYEEIERASVAEARVYRVVRAYETLHRAAALMKSGGAPARCYRALLACERAPL
jgi:hypothetical protein